MAGVRDRPALPERPHRPHGQVDRRWKPAIFPARGSSMKKLLPVAGLVLLAAWFLPGAARATAYEDAMKAVAAGNLAAALPLLETALGADPDDLKSANEY